jgi:D-alanyl-lipoteichoic acid acyltransferase DltB (MBOAT superfamily)
MLFHSLEFAVLFALVGVALVLIRKWQRQNVALLVASYVFYGWWDWRFLGLLAFSTVCDYAIALRLERTEGARARKGLVALSCLVNLGLLGFFKYADLFTSTANGIGA